MLYYVVLSVRASARALNQLCNNYTRRVRVRACGRRDRRTSPRRTLGATPTKYKSP